MERIINKGPIGYKPFSPQDFRLLSCVGTVAEPVEVDGLFYLDSEKVFHDCSTVTNYQEWCQTGWRKQHGTFEAVQIFSDKLFEEVAEVREALDYLLQCDDTYSADQAAIELQSELGDVLWCTTALASNSSVDIDAALKNRLSEYAVGVLRIIDGEHGPTMWRGKAVELSGQFDDLTMNDIDALLDLGFEPLQSVSRILHDSEPEMSVSEHLEHVGIYAHCLWNAIGLQYKYEDPYQSSDKSYDESIDLISIFAAEIYLNVAYIARQQLGISIEDVANYNVNKLQKRIIGGRVDKLDGPRTQDML